MSRIARHSAVVAAIALAVLLEPCAAHASARVLAFSKTAAFRHGSIPAAVAAVEEIGLARGWTVDATEDAAVFTAANLANYDVVLFLLTTGDVLDDAQQVAFEDFIRAGGGWVGVHAASDTEYDWPWYGSLVGAYFRTHPAVQEATIRVTDSDHPSTRMLPERWVRTDEWYDFRANPRGDVHVLATLDETTYSTGIMGYDHPWSWCHHYDGGRAWYTAGGHTDQSYSEPLFREHLIGGIEFAAGLEPGECGATIDANYEIEVLQDDLFQAIDLAPAPDGHIFYIERFGTVNIFHPDDLSSNIALELDVAADHEDGLLGIVLDPEFETRPWVYLYYSPAGAVPLNRLSRFTLIGDKLSPSSERILLEIPTQRGECCHSAGSIAFDGAGNLFVATGDNTNPFASQGFTPIDEQSGRIAFDAQGTAADRSDLRGKILRITPQPDGTYSIPADNLFPSDGSRGRPEIYVMGVRNPYRIFADKGSGWLYWGDVGPDAAADDPGRGPRGHDEFNRTREPGNFGWPYLIGDQKAYRDWNFATETSGPLFDPAALSNDSPNNGGLQSLPPAVPAWIWYPSDPSAEWPAMGSGNRAAMVGAVYDFDSTVVSGRAFSSYHDGALLVFDWMREWFKLIHFDAAGEILFIEPFLSSLSFLRPIDAEFGADGALYVLEWGTGFSTNPDNRLIRISYPNLRLSPVAIVQATPTSGPVGLDVQFSSAGTYDPNSDPLTYEWDLDGDSVVDSTDPAPRFVYPSSGDYLARLDVRDPTGNRAAATIVIAVGNTAPEVSFSLPPVDGGFYRWGDVVEFAAEAVDAEDGASAAGIACVDLTTQALQGHDEHAHPLAETARCRGELATDPDHGSDDWENLFYVVEARYTDRGGGGASRLTSFAQRRLLPTRRQAEHFQAESGVLASTTQDPDGGGEEVTWIDHGDWVMYEDLNLLNIQSLTFRAASAGPGGRIEVRADAPDGWHLASIDVPHTGAWSSYVELTTPVLDTNHFLTVDMGAQRAFASIELDATGSAREQPRGYQVYVSDDGATFRGPVARGAGVDPITVIETGSQVARWFKIILTEESLADVWSVHELRVLDEVGAPLDRSGWIATASSYPRGGEPPNALDGDPATRWSSGLGQRNGTRDVYLAFWRTPGDAALFNLNWVHFNGVGVGHPAESRPAEPSGLDSASPLYAVKSAGTVRVSVENVAGETGYVIYDNAIGSWYGAPARTCQPSFTEIGARVELDHVAAAGSRWFVVAAADATGESRAGRDRDLRDLNDLPGWPASSPCP